MKTLIIALLISSVVSGQKPASQTTPIDFFMQPYKSVSIGNYNDFRGDISYIIKDTIPAMGYIRLPDIEFGQPKPLPIDTIRALFLVTDTSLAKSVYQVFAIKGYKVLNNGYGYNDNMTTFSMKYLISYIDENKKPLRSTWVVWQTIPR